MRRRPTLPSQANAKARAAVAKTRPTMPAKTKLVKGYGRRK